MKKTISTLLVLTLILTLVSSFAFGADKGIDVTVNGEKISFLQAPVIKNGTTFVPIRSILEAFGQEVSWNKEDLAAIATDEITGMVTKIKTDSNLVTTTQNKIERVYDIQAMPMLVNGTTLIPVRAISEIFAKNVVWNQENQTVIITDNLDAKILNREETANIFLNDMVKIHYSTDGTMDYRMVANPDLIFIKDVAEGVGNHTMYFRAEKVNKDAKLEIEKVDISKKGSAEKVIETITYKVGITDPYEVALALDSKVTTNVKVGDYVKATVSENGSTGYQWFVTALPKDLQLVETRKNSPTSNLVGAPTELSFVFKVISEGEMKLELTNKRSWENLPTDQTVVAFTIAASK